MLGEQPGIDWFYVLNKVGGTLSKCTAEGCGQRDGGGINRILKEGPEAVYLRKRKQNG